MTDQPPPPPVRPISPEEVARKLQVPLPIVKLAFTWDPKRIGQARR